MKRWMIETRVTVNRTYFVDGETDQDAENLYCRGEMSADLDEEVDEEITSITEIPTSDDTPSEISSLLQERA